MDTSTIVALWFIGGAVASVLLPFVRETLDQGVKFDWRKLVGQLLAVVGVIAGQAVGLFDQLQGVPVVVAFAAGWGISGAGRQAQKAYDALR